MGGNVGKESESGELTEKIVIPNEGGIAHMRAIGVVEKIVLRVQER